MKEELRFRDIYFFHGRGGSPDGTVALLEKILSHGYPEVRYHRPGLCHSDPLYMAEDALYHTEKRFLPLILPNSLIVGVSLGGLIAAKLQEDHPELNFSVFALVTPTSCDNLKLEKRMTNRVALYSTLADDQIKGHCENWPELTDLAFDVPWLMHDIDPAKYGICYLISCYLRGLDMRYEVEHLFPDPKAEDPNEKYV